jgi:hypothetical protein
MIDHTYETTATAAYWNGESGYLLTDCGERLDLHSTRLNNFGFIARTLRESADWPDKYPTLTTWFEDNMAEVVGTKRAPRAKQISCRRHTHLPGWLENAGSDWFRLIAVGRANLRSRLMRPFS